ncbi:hypothetical protein F5Y09DRAFT_271920 [Xylaria sp. FL1042]|nr:hypothetical protein F5Y09DRAFT_271920 [Xylaria sp. FL1042]
MALPTGAAIAGFVASVLSWYGSIRNGVQLVYDDYQAAKSADKSIEELIEDVKRHQDVVEGWKLKWMIPEDSKIPTWAEGSNETHFESLYDLFWGDQKSKVKKTMELLCNRMAEANKKLRSLTSLTPAKWNGMSWAKKKLLVFVYIGAKKKYLMALRDDIAKSIKNVEEDANHAWNKKRGRGITETVKDDEIRHEGICHLLVPLAITTWQGLDGMRQICQATGDKYRTELELDIFGSSKANTMDRLSRAILSAAETRRVKLSILSQRNEETLSGHMNSSCIEKLVEVAAQSGLGGPAAILEVLDGTSTESDFVTAERIQFGIRRLKHSRAPNTERVCFWKTSTNAIRDIEIVQLRRRSLFRAAYELAQACLLFLDTAWFSNICSCELRCGMLPTSTLISEYEFALQIGSVRLHNGHRHLDDVEDACDSRNRLTQSLRRLGFMLIELYRAKISRIGCIEGKVAFIRVDRDDGSRTYEEDHTLEEFLNNPSLPQGYRDALEYCMTAEFPDSILTARESLEDALKNFYEEVIQPLQELYYDKRAQLRSV